MSTGRCRRRRPSTCRGRRKRSRSRLRGTLGCISHHRSPPHRTRSRGRPRSRWYLTRGTRTSRCRRAHRSRRRCRCSAYRRFRGGTRCCSWRHSTQRRRHGTQRRTRLRRNRRRRTSRSRHRRRLLALRRRKHHARSTRVHWPWDRRHCIAALCGWAYTSCSWGHPSSQASGTHSSGTRTGTSPGTCRGHKLRSSDVHKMPP